MKKKISAKARKKMELSARRGVWIGLVEIDKVPAFAAWLACKHGYMQQSPDNGEVLAAYSNGTTLKVYFDGKRTRCGRHEMALWLSFACFCLGR